MHHSRTWLFEFHESYCPNFRLSRPPRPRGALPICGQERGGSRHFRLLNMQRLQSLATRSGQESCGIYPFPGSFSLSLRHLWQRLPRSECSGSAQLLPPPDQTESFSRSSGCPISLSQNSKFVLEWSRELEPSQIWSHHYCMQQVKNFWCAFEIHLICLDSWKPFLHDESSQTHESSHWRGWTFKDYYFSGFEAREVLAEYLKQNEENQYECTICGAKNRLRPNVLNHVESVHFPGSFLYDCQICGKQFSSKNSRNVHVSRNHKDRPREFIRS